MGCTLKFLLMWWWGVRGARQGLSHHSVAAASGWKFNFLLLPAVEGWGVSISFKSHFFIPPIDANWGWECRRRVQKPECWLALLPLPLSVSLLQMGMGVLLSTKPHWFQESGNWSSDYLQLTLPCSVSVKLDGDEDSSSHWTCPNTAVWPSFKPSGLFKKGLKWVQENSILGFCRDN